ncbi:NAD-dependent succinate-semialdehyde dehydrogenase [Streptosporangium sp. NBC_01755]|uniref:NAD-dependent succinate-semialdehyde dehydrogenase n=1 Tax=unclassified Streptosporangium TaxID=2632669 RepID=UPI002DDC3386|nr:MULTISPECIES: NAD-dependent succinate-semialdehyde dehydrogenase [unclassified Streptosporangium]WSA24629.1 NAD-dependent succinate-semialdehyde dehydrogenase [Streptosporangium sp. NBC_01810]WSC97295.1 NAD-dependent succinate-semialdehyde dehydrogenase [Streptosporangium sp. NBC_01755]
MSTETLSLIGERSTGADPIPVYDPSTGDFVASVPDATEDDALRAVDAASAAFAAWRTWAPRRRAEVLRRCYDLMSERAEAIAVLISTENGKPLADSRGEVGYAAEFFRWYSEEAVRATGTLGRSPSGANHILTQQEPIGVAVLVTPWNFPAAMATRKIAPALAAGCTMVLKPATETPLTAFAIAEICREAGVPDGVVTVLTTRRSGPAVAAMLHDPRVRALSFTGSTEVGRRLLHESADQVLKCSMELGGNAPFLVFADADLDAAVDGLMIAKMRNGGQACTAANRIYVEQPVLTEFAERLAARMGALRVGPGTAEDTECGPLINAAAVARVSDLVDQAISAGARVLTGAVAPDGPGSFYLPTVLTDVAPTSALASEEIFGPVVGFQAFTSEDAAVEAANSTEFGLSAYVYTGDLSRGLRVAGRLESGMVAINRGLVSDPAAPFGGVKQSGLGREGAHDGLLEFTETKYIAVDW